MSELGDRASDASDAKPPADGPGPRQPDPSGPVGSPGSYWAPPLVPPPVGDPLSAAPVTGGDALPSDAGATFGEWDAFAACAPAASNRGSRRVLFGVIATLVVVLAAVGASIGLVGGTKNAEAEVIDSVNATLADHTAHVAMNVSGGAGNTSVSGTGTGAIDFTQNAMSLQATVASGGQQVSLQELDLGGVLYENVPGIGQLVPGKSWVSLDVSSLQQSLGQDPSNVQAMGNPSLMLHMLAQQGNTVVPVGPSSVDGVDVQEYAVTVDTARLKSHFANLPSWMQQALSQVRYGDVSMKVSVDGAGLLRRMTEHVSMAVASAATVSMDVSLDFSDFGVPVSVTAPPADQVVSMQEFLQAAQSALSWPG